MKKILIAIESQVLAGQLEQHLCGVYHVVLCGDGMEAAEIMKGFDPDVLVLDLMLSGMDGVSLMRLARNIGLQPQIVAITPYVSDYILRAMEDMNVSCLLRTPCDCGQLAARIMDVAYWQEEACKSTREICNILAALGFKMNTSGSHIVQLALELYIRNPGQRITAELYPATAAACNATVTKVEKAIRDSIESAWKAGDERIWRMYFSTRKNGKTAKPSNGEFLAQIGQCLAEYADEDNAKEKKTG